MSPNPTADTAGARATLSAILLCGGASRRMGADKARLTLGDSTLLEQVAAVLEEADSAELLIACGQSPRYGDLLEPRASRHWVLDGFPGAGPSAGLLAGLEAMRGDFAVVAACDMPHLHVDVLRQLVDQAVRQQLDACLFRTRDAAGEAREHPLLAVYSRRSAELIRRCLSTGRRRLIAFHTECFSDGTRPQIGYLDALELGSDGESPERNLNSPQDLAPLTATPAFELARDRR